MEGKQKERGKTERKEGNRKRNTEVGETDIAMTLGMAEKVNASSAGDNSACSNGRGREDECSSSEETGIGDGNVSKKGLLCYGSG